MTFAVSKNDDDGLVSPGDKIQISITIQFDRIPLGRISTNARSDIGIKKIGRIDPGFKALQLRGRRDLLPSKRVPGTFAKKRSKKGAKTHFDSIIPKVERGLGSP